MRPNDFILATNDIVPSLIKTVLENSHAKFITSQQETRLESASKATRCYAMPFNARSDHKRKTHNVRDIPVKNPRPYPFQSLQSLKKAPVSATNEPIRS
jgi:hypothetical protein